MPKRRKSGRRRRRTRQARRGFGAPLRQVEEKEIDLHSVLRGLEKLAAAVPEKKAFHLVEDEKGVMILKEEKKEVSPELRLLRGMFKADHPYATRLSQHGEVQTNASGVLSFLANISSVGSTSEWGSINALFDEFFVLSCTLMFRAYNKYGTAGVGPTADAVKTINTTAAISYTGAEGVCIVSLFGPPAQYASAQGMTNNPTVKVANTADDWSYTWRNNVRFDPHGMTMSTTTSSFGWQGWTNISDNAGYGGAIQMRAANDRAFGNGAHAYSLGQWILVFDVAFRSRA